MKVFDSMLLSGTILYGMLALVGSCRVPAPPTESTTKATTAKLWSADHETGDLTQWYAPGRNIEDEHGGGLQASGKAGAAPSQEHAHSGRWSAKLTIATPNTPTSGARLFRWNEARNHRELYFSVWIYIPQYYALSGDARRGRFWNLLQLKSVTEQRNRNDPLWAFYVDDSQPGTYFLKAGWGWGGTATPGPTAQEGAGGKWFYQQRAPLPVQRWVHLQMFVKESSGFDGQLKLWQDGVQLFDFQHIRTSYRNCTFNAWCAENQWSVNLYADKLSGSPAVMYVDDASISTEYIP